MARKSSNGKVKGWARWEPPPTSERERSEFERFIRSVAEHDQAVAEMDRLGEALDSFVGKKYKQDEIRKQFHDAVKLSDVRLRAKMSSFEQWRIAQTKKIFVPENEILMIVSDALMTNADALDMDGIEGLERKRRMNAISKEILEELREASVMIEEVASGDPPMCDECLEAA